MSEEKCITFGGQARDALLNKHLNDEIVTRKAEDAKLQTAIDEKQNTLIPGEGIIIDGDTISSMAAGRMLTTFDSASTNITHTFADNTDSTYDNRHITSLSLIIPDTLVHGFLSCLNITYLLQNKTVTIYNYSPYPIHIVLNSIVQDTTQVSTYKSTMSGRKTIFCHCDGVVAEISIIEELS